MMNINNIYQLWDLLIKFMYALDVSREPKHGGERAGAGQCGYMRAKTAISATAATAGHVALSESNPSCLHRMSHLLSSPTRLPRMEFDTVAWDPPTDELVMWRSGAKSATFLPRFNSPPSHVSYFPPKLPPPPPPPRQLPLPALLLTARRSLAGRSGEK